MRFNLTSLELLLCFLCCLLTYGLTRYGRKIWRWIRAQFKQRRGPRSLKPKSPVACPLCNTDQCALPAHKKYDVLPWNARKSPRGRPKTINTNGFACLNPLCEYFAIADQEIHALVSNGRRGKQRIPYFKCQACGGCRTSRFCTPLYRLKTPLVRISMVMTALSEGVDLSACGRIFGHHPQTLGRWLERAGRHSNRLHERLLHQALSIGHLQLDELVTKVKRDAERVWIWTAVAAKSKLILAIHIGRRSTNDAQHLLHQVWQRLKSDCLLIFSSDGLNQYFYAITAHFGTWHKPPRARTYQWLPDPHLLYAQLRKQRRGYKITFIGSRMRLGTRQLLRSSLQALGLTGIDKPPLLNAPISPCANSLRHCHDVPGQALMTASIYGFTFTGGWPTIIFADPTNLCGLIFAARASIVTARQPWPLNLCAIAGRCGTCFSFPCLKMST